MNSRSQLKLFNNQASAYGGDLLKSRKGRSAGRPLSTRNSMHFVLRSSQARGRYSFVRHRPKITKILQRFARQNGVRLISTAIVGNHIHTHLQLTNRYSYQRFIRAVTSAIMMACTGSSRWTPASLNGKFWDRRPFSRIVVGLKAFFTLNDYIRINRYEGWGFSRNQAKFIIEWDRGR